MTYKKLFPLFLITLLFSSTFVFAQTLPGTDPVEYNDKIVAEQTRIIHTNMEYIQESVHNDDVNAVNAKRRDVVKQLKKSLNRLQAMPGYQGKTKLRDHAIKVFEMYLETYSTDFNEALLLKNDRETSYEAMEKYMKAQGKGEKKLKKASEEFKQAQLNFAEDNDLKLRSNEELGEQMSIISEINAYTRQIFLIYFKVSKAEGAFWDGLKENKAVAMDASRKNLAVEADKALQQLRVITTFKDDKIYRPAAKELMEYYRKLAGNDFMDLVSITEKDKKEMTQEDVDLYNEVVEDYNKEYNVYIQKFNEANHKFLQAHIPKG